MEGIRGRRTVSCLTEFLGPYLNEVATVQAAAIEPSKISFIRQRGNHRRGYRGPD